MIRSFLAIDFPETVRETLAAYSQDLRRIPSKIKWVSPDQVHLTLKFFGSITEASINQMGPELLAIATEFPRMHLTLKGIGAFPNLFRPRVIWIGLGGELELLGKMKERIDQALTPLGFPKEDRPFHPHLTLGRNKSNDLNERLYQFLSAWPNEETPPFGVEAITLYRSDLKPTGPIYTQLGVFPLR
jgi:RNA 2',3'-cyclic 3'-phosphodiesterase